MKKIKTRISQYPSLPAVPWSSQQITEALQSVSETKQSIKTRIADFSSRLEATTLDIPIDQGATTIQTREQFEILSHRDDVPGAIGVREVKFLVANVDTDSPIVFFLNTNNIKYHFAFADTVLKVGLSLGEFNRVTYFTNNRRFLAGTLLAHDTFEWPDNQVGLYSLEFWPTDPVTVNFVDIAFKLIHENLPFAQQQLAYHPSGANQEELYASEREEFDNRQIRVVSTNQIFSSLTYSPLNLGVGYGKCRVIDGSDSQPPSITDVVIFKHLPNDLSHVAGVMSEEPQTPLSHINLKAKQNDTPNAYLRNASTNELIVPVIDKIIRFEVTPEEILVREATQQEMEEFLESQRPDSPQIPPRDLSQTKIASLDDLGHSDLIAFGAKASNVAELRKVIDVDFVPAGFAVPFYFYDQFMLENGLYDSIRNIIGDDDFINNPQIRQNQLRDFRRMIKRADMPDNMHDALGQMHNDFPAGKTPRCRSSTNNEDLVGFNGAGLYDSFTHRKHEGHISKSIKQVWASLWNYRAFEEREFYRIDHFKTAMAVLVHPNYDDEKANGVALTKNIYFPDFSGFYVNVQVGEAQVANPDKNTIPEELLIMEDVDLSTPIQKVYETINIRRSNLVPPGTSILSQDQLSLLTEQMELIQAHFKRVYQRQNDDTFAMDIEFKIDKDDQLAIKQARPWVD